MRCKVVRLPYYSMIIMLMVVNIGATMEPINTDDNDSCWWGESDAGDLHQFVGEISNSDLEIMWKEQDEVAQDGPYDVLSLRESALEAVMQMAADMHQYSMCIDLLIGRVEQSGRSEYDEVLFLYNSQIVDYKELVQDVKRIHNYETTIDGILMSEAIAYSPPHLNQLMENQRFMRFFYSDLRHKEQEAQKLILQTVDRMPDVEQVDLLCWAINTGETDFAQRLIKAHVDLNGHYSDQLKFTPLIHAARAGNWNVVRTIIDSDQPIDIDAKNALGDTALGCAVESTLLAACLVIDPIQPQADAQEELKVDDAVMVHVRLLKDKGIQHTRQVSKAYENIIRELIISGADVHSTNAAGVSVWDRADKRVQCFMNNEIKRMAAEAKKRARKKRARVYEDELADYKRIRIRSASREKDDSVGEVRKRKRAASF